MKEASVSWRSPSHCVRAQPCLPFPSRRFVALSRGQPSRTKNAAHTAPQKSSLRENTLQTRRTRPRTRLERRPRESGPLQKSTMSAPPQNRAVVSDDDEDYSAWGGTAARWASPMAVRAAPRAYPQQQQQQPRGRFGRQWRPLDESDSESETEQ